MEGSLDGRVDLMLEVHLRLLVLPIAFHGSHGTRAHGFRSKELRILSLFLVLALDHSPVSSIGMGGGGRLTDFV